MSSVEPRSKQAPPEDEGGKIPQRASRDPGTAKSRVQFAPVLITLATLVLAGLLAWAGWLAYMAAPWTRDGAVRVYVVTMAPEVTGRIVELPIADNQFVHKGDELFEIDPADYRIALDQARAQEQRDVASLGYARANEGRYSTLARQGWASTDVYQQTESSLGQGVATVDLDKAAIAKAQLNLSRTVIRPPVNGYVTNLQARLGRYD